MEKWKISTVDIDLLQESELNANVMSDTDFNRLVENIKISGGLSSAIGCIKKGEVYQIFSGHHRYRACVKLRYKQVPIIYADEKDMSNDELIALQTSHNSLHGEDDKGILKRLFDQIQSIQFKEFANVNIDEINTIDVDNVSFSVEQEHYAVSLIFYKKEYNLLNDLLGLVSEQTASHDVVVMTDSENTEDFYLKLMKEIERKYYIKSTSTRFQKLLELAKKALDDENRNSKRNKKAGEQDTAITESN
ncbi:MAG: ParB N-terminal domain-containing protein [Bacteroidales bacterium]|nr:ParB N-terminal domain-containing protein [Bacteroidales bacterium]